MEAERRLCYYNGQVGNVSKSVLFADDSAVARRAIRDLIGRDLDKTISCAEVAGGKEALEEALRSHPDVVVLDIAMPGLNGVEAARYITRHCPKTAVLAISNYDVGPIIPRFRDAGIRGFVCKASMGSELIPAIHALLEGKTYFADKSPTPSISGEAPLSA